jgi:protein gp37
MAARQGVLRSVPAFARFQSTEEKVKGAVIGIDLGKLLVPHCNAQTPR